MYTKIYNDLECEAANASVDWLTITAKDKMRRDQIYARFARVLAAMELMGEMPRDWAWKGFEGKTVSGFKWGTREDCDILIASGQDAASFWRVFAPWSQNCSRLDLAVTARSRKAYPGLLGAYVAWLRVNGSKTVKKATQVRKVDGIGETLYIGSRSSDQMGRVYDKGAQSGQMVDISRLWRYEVEFKDQRSAAMMHNLMQISGSRHLSKTIQSTVFRWFDLRDIPPIFDSLGGNDVLVSIQATQTDASRKLLWLSKQVRPTVRHLVEAGYEAEVCAALGLDLTE